jgi:hypothetical protein
VTALRLLPLAILFLAHAAHAGDGRIEINQICATQTGCGASDGPGFPVTTQAGQSYLMTGDITLPDANTDGIRLGAGSTLDLGGFSIVGPTTCTGTPAACTGTGNGDGISVQGEGVTIRNGRITGAGTHGVDGSPFGGSRIENVVAEGNGQDGFNLEGAGYQVIDCHASANGGDGFFGAYQGTAANLFQGNVARRNGDDGFDVTGALLLDNVAYDNLDLGLNVAYQNTDSAWGRSFFRENNEGNTNPQAAGGNQLGTNVCVGAVCP